jgi:hypothetical protein
MSGGAHQEQSSRTAKRSVKLLPHCDRDEPVTLAVRDPDGHIQRGQLGASVVVNAGDDIPERMHGPRRNDAHHVSRRCEWRLEQEHRRRSRGARTIQLVRKLDRDGAAEGVSENGNRVR